MHKFKQAKEFFEDFGESRSVVTGGDGASRRMAQRTGLEPATPGVTGRYSNRLNYRCASAGLSSEFAMVGGDGIEPPTLCL